MVASQFYFLRTSWVVASHTVHVLWLVGNKKGVKHTIVAKRISCLVSPNGSVGRAVCFYSSDYEASTLIGGKHEGCNHKKRTWLYSFFGSIGATWGNWLVAQHAPSERDIVSGCTKLISAENCAITRESSWHSATFPRNRARQKGCKQDRSTQYARCEESTTRRQLWLVVSRKEITTTGVINKAATLLQHTTQRPQHKGYDHENANVVVSQLYFQRANPAGKVLVRAGKTAQPASRKHQGESNAQRQQIATRYITREPPLPSHLKHHLISYFGGSFQTAHPLYPPILSIEAHHLLSFA